MKPPCSDSPYKLPSIGPTRAEQLKGVGVETVAQLLAADPQDLAERLAPSAGLRNVLVHEYAQVDLALVARGVELARTDYRAYVREVARGLPV